MADGKLCAEKKDKQLFSSMFGKKKQGTICQTAVAIVLPLVTWKREAGRSHGRQNADYEFKNKNRNTDNHRRWMAYWCATEGNFQKWMAPAGPKGQ